MTAVDLDPPTVNCPQREVLTRAPGNASRTCVDWLRVASIFLLIALPLACYWSALNGGFLWDDDILITKNPLIQSSGALRRIWFSTLPFDYFPLTNTTFWLEWRLWGEHPLGYHLLNLALHICSALLLWKLLRALRVPGAWLGAALFAVHPLNVASVAWIAELKNVLSMALSLGSLICFVRSESDTPHRLMRYWAAVGLFFLAALSKSSVVMLPCVMILLAWWRTGRVQWRDAARVLPFFAISLAAGLTTLWFQYHRAITVENLAQANPLPVRVIVAGRAIFFYLGKLFWPQPLAMLYPRWEVSAGDAVGYLWPVGVAAMLTVAWCGRRFWSRGPAAALGTFVLGVLPVSGLLHMSFFNYSNVSDHLAYVAVPGMLALAAASLTRLYERGGNVGRVALIAMSAIVVLLSLGCLQRAEDFSSSERLWRSTLEINPHSFAAHNNLGLVFKERGRRDPAQLVLAEAHFREALRIQNRVDSAGLNLADTLRLSGRWAESAAWYRQALAVDPQADTYDNYAVSLLEMGDTGKALGALRKALELSPSMVDAYYNLYGVELAEHHLPEACAMLRSCLRIDPNNVPAISAMVALALDTSDQPRLSSPVAEAILAMEEHACQLTQYRDAEQLLLLARVELTAGRRVEAARTAERARAVAASQGQGDRVTAIEQFQRSLQP